MMFKPILNIFKHILITVYMYCVFVICSNQKRCALENGADVSNCQPMNSDLRPFREKQCDVV